MRFARTRGRLIGTLAAGLGSLLGAACGPDNSVAEYGMPSGTYRVSGTVQSTAGNPIEGIDLRLAGGNDDAFSGPDGAFAIDTSGSFCNPDCDLTASDKDGPDNGGEFATTTMTLSMQQTEPGGGYDEGTWEAHGVLVEMAPASGGGGAGGTGGALSGGGSGGADSGSGGG